MELKLERESELERERDKSVGVRGGRTVLCQSVNNNIEIHAAHSGGGKESRTRATLTGLIRRGGLLCIWRRTEVKKLKISSRHSALHDICQLPFPLSPSPLPSALPGA